MFTRMRSSVAFSRSESYYRRPAGKARLKSNGPRTSKSTSQISSAKLERKAVGARSESFEPISDRLSVPRSPSRSGVALSNPASPALPKSTHLTVPQPKAYSADSDTPPVIPDEKQKTPVRSKDGEQRRRSWRTAMMEAKQRAWNALKSSATFHGTVSSATPNNNSATSGYCSGTTAEDEERHSPVPTRTIAAPAVHTKAAKSASTKPPKQSENACKKRSKSVKDPRTLSVPVGLCEQSSWSQESTTTTEALTLFNLSPKQRQSLRCTWYRIRGNGGLKFAERIFESLFEVAPYVKDIFYKAAFLSAFENTRRGNAQAHSPAVCRRQSVSITTCRDHAWIILRLLDTIILDRDEDGEFQFNGSITSQLRLFGAQHAFLAKSAGMRADLWEMFGEVAVDIVRRYDCIRANTDASRAWRVLFASITDEVREGYEREVRKRSCCSTSSYDCASAQQNV